MSKVDMAVMVHDIRADLHISNAEMIGKRYALRMIFPPCELFSSETNTEKLSIVDDENIRIYSDTVVNIRDLENKVFVFNAIVEHGIYGTMRVKEICITKVSDK